MASLIQYSVLLIALGMLWGAILGFLCLKLTIKRGKLPRIFQNNREKLLELLNTEEQEGGTCPQAPGSEPGIE